MLRKDNQGSIEVDYGESGISDTLNKVNYNHGVVDLFLGDKKKVKLSFQTDETS